MWVNPVAMEIDLDGGTLDIIITKWMGKYSISGVERVVVQKKGGSFYDDIRAY
jgi:hypothetical protein